MVCFPPGSTIALNYTPQYDGALLSAAPTSSSVTVIKANGSQSDVSSAASWHPTNKYLSLVLESDFFTVADAGTIIQIVYSWQYAGQTYRDSERIGITESQYGDYAILLRKTIRDFGRAMHGYFVGDGVTTEYFLEQGYIPRDKIYAYVGGSAVATSAFSTDYQRNTVVFQTAPAAQVSVHFDYLLYDYDDESLDFFIEAGVAAYNRVMSAAISLSNLPSDNSNKQLILLFALRELYYSEMLASVKDSIVWRDEEKSVTRSWLPGNYEMTLKMLDGKIKDAVKDLTTLVYGAGLVGGNIDLILFEEVDWSTANG